MNRGGGVHTVPTETEGERKGWCNKVDGRVLSRHRTKEAAVTAGRVIAKKLEVEHTIHREDGMISEKNSYGNDPHPPTDAR
jgi:hypothetical protein